MRIVVDLPAPLGPRKPVTMPGRTVKRQVVDGELVAVALAQMSRHRSPEAMIAAVT